MSRYLLFPDENGKRGTPEEMEFKRVLFRPVLTINHVVRLTTLAHTGRTKKRTLSRDKKLQSLLGCSGYKVFITTQHNM